MSTVSRDEVTISGNPNVEVAGKSFKVATKSQNNVPTKSANDKRRIVRL